jgi:hypothetical protein
MAGKRAFSRGRCAGQGSYRSKPARRSIRMRSTEIQSTNGHGNGRLGQGARLAGEGPWGPETRSTLVVGFRSPGQDHPQLLGQQVLEAQMLQPGHSPH